MQQPFLKQVAEALAGRFGKALHSLAVVFPNRRQAVYFRQHLLACLQPPALLPDLLTIEEMVRRSSGYALADPVRQSLALYEAYKHLAQLAGSAAEPMSYEDFYPIGETLISDLNEADAYGVNINRLYSIIADYKEIDNRFDDLTDEQKQFLQGFWQSLDMSDGYQQKFANLWKMVPALYTGMHGRLEQAGFSTLGKMYRNMAEQLPQLPDDSWQHIAFVGFNALNACEEKCLQAWQQAEVASLWLDADVYYLDNPLHEAGFFLRRNTRQFGLKNELPFLQSIPPANAPAEARRPLHVTKLQGQVVQAKMVSEWINNLPPNLPPGSAAILLADEKLLIPVLQSVPAGMAEVNITMGYPVAQSAVYTLLSLFFEVQEVLATKGSQKGAVPWELLMKWLNHPLNDWDAELIAKTRKTIIQQGTLWVPVEKFKKQGGVAVWLFQPMPDVQNLFVWLRNLLQQLAKQLTMVATDPLLPAITTAVYEALIAIEPQYLPFLPGASLSFLQKILLPPLGSLSVPFEMDRTAGIQIMGLLESRGLDFEHILLLGAGEGTLPRVATAKTFIPYNLRRAFGLSTLEHQDAIFAYVFYRLLHRCNQMQVVYNTLITENSTGEPSRFLQQLAFESGFDMVYSQYEMPVRATPPVEIKVLKNKAVARNLYKYIKPEAPVGLSPSAINKYLSCRLQFFFSYIANIAAPEQMQTEIDAAIFGSAVHSLLERVYERWQQQQPDAPITRQAIDTMKAWLPEMALDAIRDAWYAEQNTTNRLSLSGFEAVVADVVLHFAERFLDIDAERVPFKVHHLEVTFKQQLDLTVQGQPQRVLLKGNIDRVDEKDGVVRMVDFKTGNDKIEFASVQELLTPHGEKLNKGALQTLLYAYMFSKAHPQYKHFEPALVVLRHTLKAGFDKVRLVDKSGGGEVTAENINNYLPAVESGIKVVLEELLDTRVPFDQTPHLTTCAYCDYKGICGR